jgi:hypothetical protein
MTLALTIGVFVEETVNARSTKSSSSDTLTLCASPTARLISTANSLNYTSDNGCFCGLLPLSAGTLASVTASVMTAIRRTVSATTIASTFGSS